MAKSEAGKAPRMTKKELRKKEMEEITKYLLVKIKVGEMAAQTLDTLEQDPNNKATLANTKGAIGGFEMYWEQHLDVEEEKKLRFRKCIDMVSSLTGKKPVEVVEDAIKDVLMHTPVSKLQKAGIVSKGKPARKTAAKPAKKSSAKSTKKPAAKA